MPRPCQKRRASAASQRKSKTPAATAPPPIRHKARQKAIHNARHGRGRAHKAGGRPSRNQQSASTAEQDFISFSNKGNNFHMLSGAGSRHDPYTMDSNPDMDLDDGELLPDGNSESSESSESEDVDMGTTEDMMINVEVAQTFISKGKPKRAEVMYTVPAAVTIYRDMVRARFPLPKTRAVRYGVEGEVFTDTEPDLSLRPSPASEQPGASSATSIVSHNDQEVDVAARDYIFTWGKYAGQPFLQVPENYLRTLGGQLNVFEEKHPGLRAAFNYHRPGQARNVPQAVRSAPPVPSVPLVPTAPKRQTRSQAKQAQQTQSQAKQPQQKQKSRQQQQQKQQLQAPLRPAFPRSNVQSPSDTYRFAKGPHKGKKLSEVPENYLRTLEGMPFVIQKWPGLVPALQDFNRTTGRTGRI